MFLGVPADLIAGEYEARYFYGDDPSIPGAYSWAGPGLVCSTYDTPLTPPETQAADNLLGPGSPSALGAVYDGNQGAVRVVGAWVAITSCSMMAPGKTGRHGLTSTSGLLVSDCQCNESTVVSPIHVVEARWYASCRCIDELWPQVCCELSTERL